MVSRKAESSCLKAAPGRARQRPQSVSCSPALRRAKRGLYITLSETEDELRESAISHGHDIGELFEVFEEAMLTALGSRGLIRLANGGVQVVVGPIADSVASEMRSVQTPDSRANLILEQLEGAAVRWCGNRAIISGLSAETAEDLTKADGVRTAFRTPSGALHLLLDPEIIAPTMVEPGLPDLALK